MTRPTRCDRHDNDWTHSIFNILDKLLGLALIHPSIHFIGIFSPALFHLALYKNHIIPDDPKGGSLGVHSLFIYDTFCPPGDIWLLTQLSVISADRKIQNTLTHHSTWEVVSQVSPTDLYHGMCLWQECHHLSLCFSANPYLGMSPIASGCFIRLWWAGQSNICTFFYM